MVYMQEPAIVRIPARVGGFIGIPPGAILGVIPGILTGELLGYAAVGGYGGYQIVGTVIGSPFWALKKAFYDGPRALAKKMHNPRTEPTPKDGEAHDPD
jgi:hypothetical protein